MNDFLIMGMVIVIAVVNLAAFITIARYAMKADGFWIAASAYWLVSLLVISLIARIIMAV